MGASRIHSMAGVRAAFHTRDFQAPPGRATEATTRFNRSQMRQSSQSDLPFLTLPSVLADCGPAAWFFTA